MAEKRLYDRDEIAEATMAEIAKMERRSFILSVSHIQIGILQIWEDCHIAQEVAREIIIPLFCLFNATHPYEEVGFEDTCEVIKAMRIKFR